MTSRKLRLLHVSSGGRWRGRERQVLELAAGLAARGHSVTLAAPPGSELARRAEQAGLPVAASGVRSLRRLLGTGGWEAIHLHDAASWRSLRWACLGRSAARPPCVVSVRADVAYGRRFLSTGRPFARAAHLWAVSEWVWSALVSAGVGEDRISVIHSGVDLARFTMTPAERAARGLGARRAMGIPEEALVVGSVLCLTRGRGVEHLIEAVRMIREGEVPPGDASACLLLVGSGPARAGLEKEAARRGMQETVRFTGEREDVADLMAAMDVYVHPSAEAGGFPVALREAMALALPVVATDVMGIREILDNGRHGLIAPVGDPEGLARNILKMRRDPSLASACGRLACLKAQRYATRAMIDRAEELYLRLIR